MHVRITGDFATESRLDTFLNAWSGPTRKHFLARDYGSGLSGVVLVLMCQSPSLNLKRRRRFDRKKKTLYLDVMLNLDEMKVASEPERRRRVLQRIQEELVEALVEDKKVPDVHGERFIADLSMFLQGALNERQGLTQ